MNRHEGEVTSQILDSPKSTTMHDRWAFEEGAAKIMEPSSAIEITIARNIHCIHIA